MCDHNALMCVICLVDVRRAHEACTAAVEVVDSSVWV